MTDASVTLLFIVVAACNLYAPNGFVMSIIVIVMCIGMLLFRTTERLARPATDFDYVMLTLYAGTSLYASMRFS